jgi:hypothetical protein
VVATSDDFGKVICSGYIGVHLDSSSLLVVARLISSVIPVVKNTPSAIATRDIHRTL